MLIFAGTVTPSRAGPEDEIPDEVRWRIQFCSVVFTVCLLSLIEDAAPAGEHSPAAVQVPPNGVRAVFKLSNSGATLEPGEPTAGGRMQKTVWGDVTVPARSRVVIHTFGSDFDTAVAVYTGDSVDALTRVTLNDNFPVPGTYTFPALANKQSLVQFDALRNVPYSVQFGSVSGAEGEVYANVFFFPPGGGLSATLVALDQNAWQGQDYACGYNGDFRLAPCRTAKFLLHNSTNGTLRVTPSTDLGPGITVPAPFNLASGAAKVVTFRIRDTFDKTTVRTVSGHFTFTGRRGSEVVSTAQVRGLIVVKPPTVEPDVLEADVSPVVQAGHPNEPLAFRLRLTNTGTESAVGCHVRSNTVLFPLPHARTWWQRVKPNGDPIGAINTPASIGAGKTVLFDVIVRSHAARVADPEFPINMNDVIIDCANTQPAPQDLANAFDLTALGLYAPARVEVTKRAPAADTLNVPPAGAVFRASVVNRSPTTTLRAIPVYIKPFGEEEFPVSICRTAADNGPCLAPASGSVEYSAQRNATAFFKIFVKPPAVDPGFDPGKRRVFLKLWQPRPVTQGTFDAVVGAESVAVRKN
jgi:hypothetical protein